MPWRKHCPELREVRFTEEYAWRRAFDGDVWCKREVASQVTANSWAVNVGSAWREWEV